MEEGCARVIESRYIRCQRVDDPEHPAGPWRYYQTRSWARVELLPWDPQHEVDERRLVRPRDFLWALSWARPLVLPSTWRNGSRSRPGAKGPTARQLRRQSPSDPVRGVHWRDGSGAAGAVYRLTCRCVYDVNSAGCCPPPAACAEHPSRHRGNRHRAGPDRRAERRFHARWRRPALITDCDQIPSWRRADR